MYQFSVPFLALVVIALLYSYFDLFNKRNVPDVFAYASVVVGVVITLVYYQNMLILSFSLALLIGIVGYALYRGGLWGAGDYFELAAISLMLPLQPDPIFGLVNQLGLPFIISVLIGTGFAATWIVPIYYLLFVRGEKKKVSVDSKHVAYGLMLLILFLLFFVIVYSVFGFTLTQVALMLFLVVPSTFTIAFEDEITARMARHVYPNALEQGDIIAISMMSEKERAYFTSRYRKFGRLVTGEMIGNLKRVRKKLPVYKNAAPLAAFILIGIIVSLLFGNIVLLII